MRSRGRRRRPQPRPSIRPRRFAAVLVPSLALGGVLAAAVGQGALAASFAVSGRDMKVSADRIEGTGYVTYPSVARSADGTEHAVTVLAVKTARVRALCQSSVLDTPLGRYVLRLSAAPDGPPVRVSDLALSATSIDADLGFTSLQLNRDAASLDAVPGYSGAPGHYGIQALGFAVTNVRVRSWSVFSSSIHVKGLRLAVGRDEAECF
ncbi:hypothetical protein EDD29_2876 [Actinocorallia herbida]|uniref:Cholesterol esterase n=1 Tax=Actinocorallia herbida TaxID=58109 RepID=A0A3N1CVK7_9ACTN|nr:DUF6230 family protein [Actinocorallia herbida]ROO85333.1 hypothetical protein EDD29_2876 [Actinocorallia herbida]